MTRLVLAAAFALCFVVPVPPAQAAGEGFLHLERFVPKSQREQFRGFVEPRLFVYDTEGHLLSSDARDGGYGPGARVGLPEGDYLVEVAHQRQPANRWRYTVKAGKVTVVRSGMVVLPTTPLAEQTPDVCKQWRAVMHVYVPSPDGELLPIMSNEQEDVDDFGMLQLHEGEYVFAFNGLRTELGVRAGHSVTLPTARVDPMPTRGYILAMAQDESATTPSITLCTGRATQVLEGSYWGGYYVELRTPPFRRRVWEAVTIGGGGRRTYKKAPAAKIEGAVLKGKAAAPRRP